MVEKNFIIFDKGEMQIIAKGLVLLIKDTTGIANFNEVLSLLNKVNSQFDSSMAIEEKKKNSGYICVKYEDKHWPRTFGGKEYSYYTEFDVEVGDIVEAPTKYGSSYAKVTKVNVPEEKIEDIKPSIREITRKLDKERFIYYNEIKDAA